MAPRSLAGGVMLSVVLNMRLSQMHWGGSAERLGNTMLCQDIDGEKAREGLDWRFYSKVFLIFLPSRATLKAQDKIFRLEWGWAGGKWRRLEVGALNLPLFIWRFLVRANQVRDFCSFAPERESGGRERENMATFSPWATWSISHVTHSKALKRRREGHPAWGWGREDALAVNPVQRHLVSLPGSRLWAKGKAENSCEYVSKLSWRFMAFSKLLCKDGGSSRRPKEAVRGIKSGWRYVMEILGSCRWILAQMTEYLLSLPQAVWRFLPWLKCLVGALDLFQKKRYLGSSVKWIIGQSKCLLKRN